MATDAYGAAADHAGLSGLTVGDPHTQYTRTLWGLAAARPGQPVREGTRYLATDTSVETVSTGSAWISTAVVVHTHDYAATAHTHAVGGDAAWTSVTFNTGVQNVNSAGYQGCQYRKDALGYVVVRGYAVPTSGSIATGTTLFTLPAGYRPLLRQTFPSWGYSASAYLPARIDVDAAGLVTVHVTSTTTDVALGAVRFIAEA